MNYILTGIAFFVGIFIGVLVVALFTVIPESGLTPMVILYSAGTIIALCALGLTLYQAQSTRRHNELTLTPRINIATADYTNLNTNNLLDITVLNTGLGPAEINDAYFEFFHDGKKSQYALSTEGIDAYINKVFTEYPTPHDSDVDKIHKLLVNIATTQRPYREIHSFAKNELIASKDEKTFLRLELPTSEHGVNLTNEQKAFMKKAAYSALNNTKIVIEYKSLYGKSYVYAERFRRRTK